MPRADADGHDYTPFYRQCNLQVQKGLIMPGQTPTELTLLDNYTRAAPTDMQSGERCWEQQSLSCFCIIHLGLPFANYVHNDFVVLQILHPAHYFVIPECRVWGKAISVQRYLGHSGMVGQSQRACWYAGSYIPPASKFGEVESIQTLQIGLCHE